MTDRGEEAPIASLLTPKEMLKPRVKELHRGHGTTMADNQRLLDFASLARHNCIVISSGANKQQPYHARPERSREISALAGH